MYNKNGYLEIVRELLDKVVQTQTDAMESAANIICQCIEKDKIIYTFGTGHSSLLAIELFYRAGGLVQVCPIIDERLMLHNNAVKSTYYERLDGIGKTLVQQYPIEKDDVVIIMSNSGRNTATVELAIEAKKAGATIIALTNMKHSSCTDPRNKYKKHLYEVADIVLDNCGSVGDAAVQFEGIGAFAPTSTVIGAAILWNVLCSAVNKSVLKGNYPDVFTSSNVDGGDEKNHILIEKYKTWIKAY